MTRKQTIEEGIQRVVIEMRDLWAPQIPRLGLLFHIPNGGQRNAGEAGRLKAMGTVPGMPDLCLPVRTFWSGALYIEMKKPGGKLSGEQKRRIPLLQEAGNDVQVADSVEKAWANIMWYLTAEHRISGKLSLNNSTVGIVRAMQSLKWPGSALRVDQREIGGRVHHLAVGDDLGTNQPDLLWRIGDDVSEFTAFVNRCSGKVKV